MGSNSEQVIGRAKAHLLQNYRTQPVVAAVRGRGLLCNLAGERTLRFAPGLAILARALAA